MMESQSARTEDEKIRNNAAFFFASNPRRRLPLLSFPLFCRHRSSHREKKKSTHHEIKRLEKKRKRMKEHAKSVTANTMNAPPSRVST
mmetsp:Transcript_8268/g.15759  ORF Transcript_8268/g.15759 Transcript_8268/m.15759 type:complete len:88 (+) Transcript_8268:385-648(+)